MIKAMIFDLDGTLVQTERMKALSYARAAVELCPYTLRESEVVEAFKEVVGLPRREVARTLVERFGLYEAAGMHGIAVSTPFTHERLHQTALLPPAYIVDDPATLIEAVEQLVAHHGD